MNKGDLVAAIKEARGIKDESKKTNADIRQIKGKIRDFKQQRNQALEANDGKKAAIFRRRISRLKKKTRQAA
jgi:protein-arginine kinase activator protein McsA